MCQNMSGLESQGTDGFWLGLHANDDERLVQLIGIDMSHGHIELAAGDSLNVRTDNILIDPAEERLA